MSAIVRVLRDYAYVISSRISQISIRGANPRLGLRERLLQVSASRETAYIWQPESGFPFTLIVHLPSELSSPGHHLLI